MSLSIAWSRAGGSEEIAAENGAIGDRGLHSDNSRIGQVANGTRKIRQSLALKKAKLVAIVIVVLLVGVFAVALIQGHVPSMISTKTTLGPGWGTAQLIEDNSGDAEYPEVAMDSAGNAIAVWNQSDGTRNNIWSNRYVVGTGWGTAELIEDDSGNAVYPEVAMDSAGNAVAVWDQSDGIRSNIWSNRYVVGTGWGTAELIETDDSGDAWDAQVAVDSAGNAVAVWNGGWYIWSNRYVVGTGWGTAEQIPASHPGAFYSPQVAVDSAGNAVAVWWEYWELEFFSHYSIWASRYAVGTGWETTQLVKDELRGASDPQVAVDSAGNAVAVWIQNGCIWSNRYVFGTGWETAQHIGDIWDMGNAYVPQVAVDSAGNAVAVWYQMLGTRNIWSNRYVFGTGWETAQRIDDHLGEPFAPQVAVDSAGNAVAVWHCRHCWNIISNRYVVGTGWETARLIEDNSEDAWRPQVAMDSAGNAVAVWVQFDGTHNNIWSNRYEQAPPIPEFSSQIVLLAVLVSVIALVVVPFRSRKGPWRKKAEKDL